MIKFKIGDKVKPIGNIKLRYNRRGIRNLNGTIINITNLFEVLWSTNKCILCGNINCNIPVHSWYYHQEELEHIYQEGEQLMLFDLD